MSLGDGGAGQIAIAIETTPGVPVTPTIFSPFVSESLGQDIARIEGDDIIAGRRILTSEQWAPGDITVSGDVQLEFKNKQMGKWLALFTGVPVTTGSDPYTHTFGMGDLPSATIQKGVPATDGTVYPLTYAGCRGASCQFAFEAGKFLTFGATVAGIHEIGYRQTSGDGNTTDTETGISSATANFTENDIGKPISGANIPAGATIASVQSSTEATLSAAATGTATTTVFTLGVALASASYPSALRSFKYQQGVCSVGGTSVKVKSGTLNGDMGLDTSRRFVGQAYIDEPLEAGRRTWDGSLMLEFRSNAEYLRFVRGQELALSLVFTSGADTLTATGNIRYDGETPKVGGRGIVPQNLPFKVVAPAGGTDAQGLQWVLVNTDSAY